MYVEGARCNVLDLRLQDFNSTFLPLSSLPDPFIILIFPYFLMLWRSSSVISQNGQTIRQNTYVEENARCLTIAGQKGDAFVFKGLLFIIRYFESINQLIYIYIYILGDCNLIFLIKPIKH